MASLGAASGAGAAPRGSSRARAPGAPAPDGFAAIARCLEERDLPLLIHANEPVGHHYPGKGRFTPEACFALAQAHPALTIVFAHMGGGLFLYELMPEVRRALARVYYDTSAVPYLYGPDVYAVAVSCAGEGKLIFGSDYPLLSPGRYFEGFGGLAPGARAAALGDTARKVFRAMSDGAHHGHDLRRLLEGLVAGDMGLEDVLQKLRLLQVTQLGEFARLDTNRDLRKGVPEVIYAPRKSDPDLASIVRHFLADRGLALVSRLEPDRAEVLRQALTGGTEAGRARGLDRATRTRRMPSPRRRAELRLQRRRGRAGRTHACRTGRPRSGAAWV